MAYTIQFFAKGNEKRSKFLQVFQDRLHKDGRFKCELEMRMVSTTKADRLQLTASLGTDAFKMYELPGILIRKIRLTKKKPYCGNHPGECPVSDKPKPNSTRLEWDDWVEFNNLINRTLNRFRAEANMWSLPHDIRGRMWMRKGILARKRYDWDEQTDQFGRTIRIWNPGTESQF